jgi:hypothetical protein
MLLDFEVADEEEENANGFNAMKVRAMQYGLPIQLVLGKHSDTLP